MHRAQAFTYVSSSDADYVLLPSVEPVLHSLVASIRVLLGYVADWMDPRHVMGFEDCLPATVETPLSSFLKSDL
jgi:hypothetical protein